MFTPYPPSDEALWLLEHILFGWWWHPLPWFGFLLAVSIAISTARAALKLTWRAALILVLLSSGAHATTICTSPLLTGCLSISSPQLTRPAPPVVSTQPIGSCWSCMHGCTEAERLELCHGIPPAKPPAPR